MKKTVVIMAAGLGSRFGAGEGQKQVTPVDEQGHLIIDFSVFDALRAGFEKVVFVIKPESESVFHKLIGANVEPFIEVAYAHQTLTSCLPEGFCVPEGRAKPWGTGHAALCAAQYVPDGFICINADDFYGEAAFLAAAEFLDAPHSDDSHAMVGYKLKNTMTPNGSVARGVCAVDGEGLLTSITERTKIFANGENSRYTEDDEHYYPLDGNTPVSMNFWIFNHSVFPALSDGFERFLRERMPLDPVKKEFYLPDVPGELIRTGKGSFKVLPTEAKWFGLTYMNDLDATREGLKQLRAAGRYPEDLWKRT